MTPRRALPLLAAAVLAFAAAALPAAGQTSITLVSNTGQSATNQSFANDWFNAFTVGSSTHGYTLTGVDIILTLGGSLTATYEVRIHRTNTDGSLGSSLGTLSPPSTVSHGTNTFTTSGIDLSAGTYAVVFDVSNQGNDFGALGGTGSDDEDSGAATGWSIANGGRWRAHASSGSWTSDNTGLRFAIKGFAKTLGPAAPGTPTVTKGSTSGALAVEWTAPAGTITDYDLRYFKGSADPTDADDWVTESAGLPDPGTATSDTIKGLLANTAYRVQVRAANADGEGHWSASGSQTTATAPSGNNAPRLLELKTGDANNACQVKTGTSTPSATLAAAAGTRVSTGRFITRGSETAVWPTECTRTFGGNRQAAFFDDRDAEQLFITMDYTLPDNVRVSGGTPRLTQPTAQPGATGAGGGNLTFLGFSAFEAKTNVRVDLTATDPHGASVSTHIIFEVSTIPPTLGAPTLSTVRAQSFAKDQEITPLVLPAATGGDVNTVFNTPLPNPYFYKVTGLPAGLSFDPSTRTVSGTPTTLGSSTVTYTAEDADSQDAGDTPDPNDTASQTFTITIAATVNPPTLSAAEVDGTTLTLTFSESLSTTAAPAASRFTVAGTATATTVTGVAFKSGDATKVELTLSAAVGADDTGITVSYAKPTANPLQSASGTEVADFTGQSVTNVTLPTVTAASVNGTALTLTFDAALSSATAPATSRFTVSGTSQTTTVTAVAIPSADATKVNLTLSPRVGAAETGVTVAYTKGTDANPLKATGTDNEVANFTGQTVTNNTPPAVTSVTVASTPAIDTDSDDTPDTYGLGEIIRIKVAFDENVSVDATGGTPQVQIDMTTSAGDEQWASYESAVEESLFFTYTVTATDASTAGIAVLANTLELNGGTIQSATGVNANLAHTGLAHDANHKVAGSQTGAAPEFRSAVISASTMTVTFNKGLDATSRPAGRAFTLSVHPPGGGPATQTISGTGTTSISGAEVTVTLASSPPASDPVDLTLSYAKPSANPLKDAGGGEVADFSETTIGKSGSGVRIRILSRPSAPAAPTVTRASATSLSVSWRAPSNASAITDYDLRYYQGTSDPANEADWIEEGEANGPPNPGTSTSATITGLTANAAYVVQVRAKNSAGTGPWSASGSISAGGPTTPPAPPGRGTLSADGATATLDFAYTLDASSVPDPGDFTVTLAAASASTATHRVTAVSIRGSALDLTISPPVPAGRTAVVSYTKGASPLRAADGREVPDFGITPSPPSSPPPPPPPPTSNRAPAFESDQYALELPENLDGSVKPVVLDTLAATDPDGDELSYLLVWTGGDRFEAGEGSGAILYVGPGEDFEAEPTPYQLALRAIDPDGASAETYITVTVVDANDAPEAADDAAATDEDTAVEVDVLANDTDIDGDDLRVSSVSAPENGTAAVTAEGGVLYTPAANWHGTDRFTYLADDGRGGTAEASVEVTVAPVNDAPEAADDEAVTVEDQAVEVDVLANDTDADGDDLRIASVSTPEHGTAAVTEGGGGVLYTPPANWHGTDSFSYTIDDGRGGTAEASVTVTVRPENDAPAAADDEAATDEDVAVEVDVLANDTDIDGDDLRVASVSAPSNGTAVVAAAGGVLYTPAANWHGTDSFTYTIDDGHGGTAEASVEVTVAPVNDPPQAAGDEAATDEDVAVEVDVLANDTDIDGDDLRVSSVSAPSNGTAVVAAAGVVRYTPEANWHGTDSFTYAIDDGNGGTADASVEVTVLPVNDPPEAADDEAETDEDMAVTVAVLANDTDIDGDALRVASVSAPANGTAAVAAGGVVYTPDANWYGTDAFTYTIDDGRGGTAEASVTVTVLPVNDPPEAADDEAATDEDRAVEVDVLANDTDIDGDALRVASVSAPSNGTAAVAAGGRGVRYTPEANWHGTDSFTYAIDDGNGGTAEGSVEVTVAPVNDAPEAADDAASTNEDVAVTVDVLANDTDPDGDGLTVSSVSAPANGTAELTAGGRGVRYTPAADWHGTDRFTYAIDDGNGGTASASVEVTVLPVNDGPVSAGAIPDQSLDEGGEPARVELGPFFADTDGDALEYRASSSDPAVVEASVSGSVLTLVPAGYGTAEVTVTAADASGLMATQTVSVGVSDRPAREAVSHTLAGLARSHLASARMTLGRRATASRHESSRLTLLGRKVPLGTGSARSTAEQMWAGWLSGVTSRAMSQATPYASASGMPGFAGGVAAGSGMPGGGGTTMRAGASMVGAGGSMDAGAPPGAAERRGSGDDMGLGDLFRLGDLVRLQGGRDPLHGSEFLFALGGGQDAGDGGGGLRLQLWGQGDVQTFQGAPSDASDYDGELRTGYVGVDTWLTDRWLLGVAVARSEGTGGWRAGSVSGSLDTRLLAVHPYLRWSSGGTSIWATGGAGWGDAENVRDRGGRTETSELGLRLGLVELRQRLASGGGFEFGLRADAGWAELATDTGTETLDDQTAAVNQARVGIEMSQSIRLGGLTLTPFGEANARRDGGAGQTGDGLEVAGGLRARAGFLRIDAQGRMLAVHTAAGYEERGLAVTLSLGNPGGEGPSLSMSPRWGDAATGGDALWREQIESRYVPAQVMAVGEPTADGSGIAPAVRDPWALDLRGGYGLRVSGDRLLTWTGSFNHSPAGPRFTLGAQIGLGIGRSSGTDPGAGAMVP